MFHIIDIYTADFKNVEKLDKYELLKEEIEIQLVQKLEMFKDIMKKALEKLTPNIIANYVYDITKLFANYYHEFSVLNIDNVELKNMRLQLIYSGICNKEISRTLRNRCY